MFPVVPMISREVTEAHPSGICPRFNEGSTFGVAINMFGLHYNPRGWAQPEQFLPERWLDPTIDGCKDPSQRVYCPFAIGKRSCLGRHFAYVDMLTVVAAVLRRYQIVVIQPHPPKLSEAGTLLIDPDFRLGLRPLPRDFCPSPEPSRPLGLAQRAFTLAEVSSHGTKESLWMAIGGSVYDLTRFADGADNGHPGGAEILRTYAGTDATAEFEFISHSAYATRLLKKYRIGRLAAAQAPLFKERGWKTGGFRETVRVFSEDWDSSPLRRSASPHRGARRRRRPRSRSAELPPSPNTQHYARRRQRRQQSLC